jgi:hypothetical protein
MSRIRKRRQEPFSHRAKRFDDVLGTRTLSERWPPAVKSIKNISTSVSSNLTIEQAFQLKRNAFNAQVIFSNLGRLPFDSTFGPLKLESLWHHVHSAASKQSRPLEQSPSTARCTSRTRAPRLSPACSRERRRTPQSLRDLTQFPTLAIQNGFKALRFARMRYTMKIIKAS